MKESSDNPIITIVTVCKNAKATIRNTMQSVLDQTFTNYEYIIVDGLSTDDTCKIIKEYINKFKNKGITIKYISEKDKGIYDAMNKAINMAEGKWINFMNADDKFNNNYVLEKIFKHKLENYDIIYGNTVQINKNQKVFSKGRPLRAIKNNLPFCHQSCFTKTILMKKHPFNLSYKIASDYNFFLGAYFNSYRFHYINITIADYSLEGFSNRYIYISYLEKTNIKHAWKLLDKNCLEQKLKNIYFKNLLLSKMPLHYPIVWFDRIVKNRPH